LPDTLRSLDPAGVVIAGAGAAGLAAAIHIRRFDPSRAVVLLERARKPGAKILVSGGSRCNVTNTIVNARDFNGGRTRMIQRVFDAFTAGDTVRFFSDLGVPLHEEANGKLFPNSNRSRDVLDALLNEAARVGVTLVGDCRVIAIDKHADRFEIQTTQGALTVETVVMATGGQSLPKSGSDGTGFAFAQHLGHTIVQTTPALVPLILDDRESIHRQISGVSQDVDLSLWIDGRIATKLSGSMLWTHTGVSGPVAMNLSRHWLRACEQGRQAAVTASFCPGRSFDEVDAMLVTRAAESPRASIHTILSTVVPASVASAMLSVLTIDGATTAAHLTREHRRRLVRGLVEWPLPVAGSRGYTYAEATAGGVNLDEIDPGRMESRRCPGLFLIGEVLDVDGRIGGFNFQWAWSSAFVAARAITGR